jgi:hypothetical protein
MIRTQIQLTEEQYHHLKELAQTNRESLATLVRRAVDQLLLIRRPDQKELYRQAFQVLGRHSAGLSDAAQRHDHYLDEGMWK